VQCAACDFGCQVLYYAGRTRSAWGDAVRVAIPGGTSTKSGSRMSIEHMETPWSPAEQPVARATSQPFTFEELFWDEHERLYRALYLIVGNSQEAEELMQDAFVHVLERWDRIDSPAGYLYRSAFNSTRSRFRRLQLAARRTLSIGEPEDPFAAADLRDQVVRSLRELPKRQRAALVLLDLLDYPSAEAAAVLGVTSATVRSLASHARATLKLSMEAEDDE
jgi:RNA polymerase sigma factor (sigma-70 family)